MSLSRRSLLSGLGALAGSAAFGAGTGRAGREAGAEEALVAAVDRAAGAPVLSTEGLADPVVIESLDLMRQGQEILVRARSRSGVEAWSVTNSWWLHDTFPIFLNRVAPFLVGRDARRLESLLEALLVERITYKLQGLALWVSIAAAEMAVLELLGRVSGKPIGALLGGVRRREIPLYRASHNRGNRPEEEVEYLRGLIEETGVDAVKIRLGTELGANAEAVTGRTEALIPLVRERLGDDVTLYADANSAYDAAEGTRIGRLLEASGYGFYEEPCRFDDLWETRRIAEALDIPVAGGEQESSQRRFRWTILNRGLDVVQPDLHYYGGYLRAMRVARMADAAGLTCTPHMSGWGVGYLNALHFMSCVPNPARHLEFKGLGNVPFHSETSSLKSAAGVMRVPSGPGFGVEIDPAWLARARPIEAPPRPD